MLLQQLIIQDGLVFNDLQIISATNIFSNAAFISGNNPKINLSGTDSFLDFQEGGILSTGSKLDVGYGKFKSDSNLTVKENATLSIAYDGTEHGDIIITNGVLDLSATGAKVLVQGKAKTSSGTIDFLDANSVNGAEKIKADLGWLTSAEVNTNTYQVLYQYQPLDGYISGISSNLNDMVRTDDTIFSALNGLSEKQGTQLIRFTEKQAADNVDISIQTQHQLSNVIITRTSEVRGKNNTAKVNEMLRSPYGSAGPSKPSNQMQGWIRGYKSSSSRDETDLFTGYEADTSGTILGFDNRSGKLIFGVSAGTAISRINALNTYHSSIDSTQIGVYASFDGEKSYFDFAYTQSDMDHEVTHLNLPGVNELYSASIASIYLGAGRSIDINKWVKIIPELSLLVSKYEQDAYERKGIHQNDTKQIGFYSTDSCLISIGTIISTKDQIDWFNRGLSMTPEFRLHMLGELSPEMNDISYTNKDIINGNQVLSAFVLEKKAFSKWASVSTFGAGISMQLNFSWIMI